MAVAPRGPRTEQSHVVLPGSAAEGVEDTVEVKALGPLGNKCNQSSNRLDRTVFEPRVFAQIAALHRSLGRGSAPIRR